MGGGQCGQNLDWLIKHVLPLTLSRPFQSMTMKEFLKRYQPTSLRQDEKHGEGVKKEWKISPETLGEETLFQQKQGVGRADGLVTKLSVLFDF